jgi:hypothetical protein
MLLYRQCLAGNRIKQDQDRLVSGASVAVRHRRRLMSTRLGCKPAQYPKCILKVAEGTGGRGCQPEWDKRRVLQKERPWPLLIDWRERR